MNIYLTIDLQNPKILIYDCLGRSLLHIRACFVSKYGSATTAQSFVLVFLVLGNVLSYGGNLGQLQYKVLIVFLFYRLFPILA